MSYLNYMCKQSTAGKAEKHLFFCQMALDLMSGEAIDVKKRGKALEREGKKPSSSHALAVNWVMEHAEWASRCSITAHGAENGLSALLSPEAEFQAALQ